MGTTLIGHVEGELRAPGSYLVVSFSPDPSADMAPQFLTGHLLEVTIG